jgi:hypothetical protein
MSRNTSPSSLSAATVSSLSGFSFATTKGCQIFQLEPKMNLPNHEWGEAEAIVKSEVLFEQSS